MRLLRPFGIRHSTFVIKALAALVIGHSSLAINSATAAEFDLATANLADIEAATKAGALSSEKLVNLYLARIAAYDKQGPKINAVIHLNPTALAEAKVLDAERATGKLRGPLHGIPVVVKDLVDVAGLPTTGGFKPFGDPIPARDSAVAARLKASGAIILAKVNTANWFGKGFDHTSRIGATHNPYKLGYTPGTSSNGPGAAMAAWFAAVSIGTDTGGSVVIPSSNSGVTGMIATQGLVSRAGIMPRGATQDRAGPMARSTYDVAVVLSVIAGWDVEDLITNDGIGHFPEASWPAQIATAKLHGKRIGILREMIQSGPAHTEGIAIFERALDDLRKGGAQVMDVATGLDLKVLSTAAMGRTAEYEKIPLQNAYLARFGANAPFKTIQEMIAKIGPDQFDKAMNNALLLPSPDQSPEYLARRRLRTQLRRAISDVCERNELDALVLPFSTLPPSKLEAPGVGGTGNSLASNNGLPSVIVPGGYTTEGLPMGVQFLGAPFSDLTLLSVAHAYEKASARRVPPSLTPSLPGEKFTY
jgi:amidase